MTHNPTGKHIGPLPSERRLLDQLAGWHSRGFDTMAADQYACAIAIGAEPRQLRDLPADHLVDYLAELGRDLATLLKRCPGFQQLR